MGNPTAPVVQSPPRPRLPVPPSETGKEAAAGGPEGTSASQPASCLPAEMQTVLGGGSCYTPPEQQPPGAPGLRVAMGDKKPYYDEHFDGLLSAEVLRRLKKANPSLYEKGTVKQVQQKRTGLSLLFSVAV